jgi:hypothetical protein
MASLLLPLGSLTHLEADNPVAVSVPYPSLSRVNERTGEDSLWDSSLLTHRRHFSGRRGCSIHRAHQSACSRQHPRLITSSLDAWLTCCWHFASLKLFFCMHAFKRQLTSSIEGLVCLSLWMAHARGWHGGSHLTSCSRVCMNSVRACRLLQLNHLMLTMLY